MQPADAPPRDPIARSGDSSIDRLLTHSEELLARSLEIQHAMAEASRRLAQVAALCEAYCRHAAKHRGG